MVCPEAAQTLIFCTQDHGGPGQEIHLIQAKFGRCVGSDNLKLSILQEADRFLAGQMVNIAVKTSPGAAADDVGTVEVKRAIYQKNSIDSGSESRAEQCADIARYTQVIQHDNAGDGFVGKILQASPGIAEHDRDESAGVFPVAELFEDLWWYLIDSAAQFTGVAGSSGDLRADQGEIDDKTLAQCSLQIARVFDEEAPFLLASTLAAQPIDQLDLAVL